MSREIPTMRMRTMPREAIVSFHPVTGSNAAEFATQSPWLRLSENFGVSGQQLLWAKSLHGEVPVNEGDHVIFGDGEAYPITRDELGRRYTEDGAISDELDWNLTNHRPTDEAIAMIEQLRAAARTMGASIEQLCPHTRERSLAITNLEQMLMWAVASIARNAPAEGQRP